MTDRLLAKLDLSHDSVVTNELYGNVFEPLACLIQLVMYLFRDGAGRLNHLMRSESWATCSEGSTASEATGQAFTPWDDLMNSICIPRVLDFPVRNGRGNVEANKPHAIIRVNVDVALIRTSQFSLVSGSLSHRRGQWSARSPRPSAGLRCQKRVHTLSPLRMCPTSNSDSSAIPIFTSGGLVLLTATPDALLRSWCAASVRTCLVQSSTDLSLKFLQHILDDQAVLHFCFQSSREHLPASLRVCFLFLQGYPRWQLTLDLARGCIMTS